MGFYFDFRNDVQADVFIFDTNRITLGKQASLETVKTFGSYAIYENNHGNCISLSTNYVAALV